MVMGTRCVARRQSPMARCSQISAWGERFCMRQDVEGGKELRAVRSVIRRPAV